MGIYLVMKNNLRRSLHHKLLFGITFLLPVILCLIAGSIKLGGPSFRIGILVGNPNIKETLNEKVYPIIEISKGMKIEDVKEASLNTDLISGKYHVVMDYRESDAPENFELLSFQNESKKALLHTSIQEAIRNHKEINLSGLSQKTLTATQRSVALLITLFMIISTIHAAPMILDRNNGTYTRYRFASIKSGGYVIGYGLYNFIITFIQISASILILSLVQSGFRLNFMASIIMAVAVALISVVFSILVSLFSKSEVQANITASSLAAVLSLLGGAFVAIESMPKLLQILSTISPVRWMIELTKLL
ncbi:ABC transporter permease [Mobilitalea sibirica]|uniref:ABC transporter permease n=1 Tax=Mobilitalea sibirica TaxID=1462919 RepID=A0A8J7HAE0_9FIRM|nr:ABC transporter permease [Mobilitalea sibirica]MBH1939836.1 ABC transporter permease [Mobilitalea sibirica]